MPHWGEEMRPEIAQYIAGSGLKSGVSVLNRCIFSLLACQHSMKPLSVGGQVGKKFLS